MTGEFFVLELQLYSDTITTKPARGCGDLHFQGLLPQCWARLSLSLVSKCLFLQAIMVAECVNKACSCTHGFSCCFGLLPLRDQAMNYYVF